MQRVTETDIDLFLDANGQPVAGADGDFKTTDRCWLQDIANEALTEEGELFYEDEEGDDAYGLGLHDFLQVEYDDFTFTEIEERIRTKLKKRSYIDDGSIVVEVTQNGQNGFHAKISFRRNDSSQEYNISLESNGVEVVLE